MREKFLSTDCVELDKFHIGSAAHQVMPEKRRCSDTHILFINRKIQPTAIVACLVSVPTQLRYHCTIEKFDVSSQAILGPNNLPAVIHLNILRTFSAEYSTCNEPQTTFREYSCRTLSFVSPP